MALPNRVRSVWALRVGHVKISAEIFSRACVLKFILSSLYVCMAIKHIIVLFVETPRKFITVILLALMKIRAYGSKLFAVINLRGVSTNKAIIKFIL